MSKAVRISRYGIVHAHLTIVLSPKLGLAKGKQWTFRTVESVDITLGLKYASIGGTQITPVAIALAGSEPKWNAELSFAEVRNLRRFIGPGWAQVPCNLTMTWQVPGQPAFTDLIFDAYIGDDGTSSKKDDVVKSKIGSQVAAVWPDGLDPFAPLS